MSSDIINLDFDATTTEATSHEGSPALHRPVGRAVKRLLDICLSLPIVCIVIPPLCVVVRLLHWSQSPGPLFFRQVRAGRAGKPFRIWKFRTMNVPSEGQCEIADAETRIFAAGELLRRFKIDELPQFINVLLGNMSIVGPRPHHFDDCRNFSDQLPDYERRKLTKPGITGLAQYCEYRGDFEWNHLPSRVMHDLRYIDRWTIWTDVALIVGTASLVVTKGYRAMRRQFSQPQVGAEPVVLPIAGAEETTMPASESETRRAA